MREEDRQSAEEPLTGVLLQEEAKVSGRATYA